MGRVSKKRNTDAVEIEVVKQKLRACIEKEYGGIAQFLKTDTGEKFGGMAIRPYLYDKGAISFKVLKNLCEHFGVGELTKEVETIRNVTYTLKEVEV